MPVTTKSCSNRRHSMSKFDSEFVQGSVRVKLSSPLPVSGSHKYILYNQFDLLLKKKME
jgi:hypothetical protein